MKPSAPVQLNVIRNEREKKKTEVEEKPQVTSDEIKEIVDRLSEDRELNGYALFAWDENGEAWGSLVDMGTIPLNLMPEFIRQLATDVLINGSDTPP